MAGAEAEFVLLKSCAFVRLNGWLDGDPIIWRERRWSSARAYKQATKRSNDSLVINDWLTRRFIANSLLLLTTSSNTGQMMWRTKSGVSSDCNPLRLQFISFLPFFWCVNLSLTLWAFTLSLSHLPSSVFSLGITSNYDIPKVTLTVLPFVPPLLLSFALFFDMLLWYAWAQKELHSLSIVCKQNSIHRLKMRRSVVQIRA